MIHQKLEIIMVPESYESWSMVMASHNTESSKETGPIMII
jgi:hypothetical protein